MNRKNYILMFILFSLAETDNTWIFAAANNTDISLPENCTLIEEQSNETIKYGDYLRIRHSENGFFLHSHAIRYFHPQSSYQQQVTCFRRDEKTANKEACWWQILGAQGSDESELRGKIVDVSQPIRLRAQSVSNPEKDHNYIINKMMLHSHNYAEWQHPSPSREDDIERNQQEKKQEVTCYSDNDSNDNWIAYLELPTSSSLKLKSLFTLQHKNSQKLLRSKIGILFNVRGESAGSDRQAEVCCVKEKDQPRTTWRVALVAREIESEK